MSYVEYVNGQMPLGGQAKAVQVSSEGFFKRTLRQFLANYDKHVDMVEPEVWGFMQ
jgi:hypothetical protein